MPINKITNWKLPTAIIEGIPILFAYGNVIRTFMEKNKMGSESDSKEIRLATDIDLQADVEVTVERHL